MVVQGRDLNSSSTTITTPGFWVVGGDITSAPVPYFSHQDGVCLDWFKNITASQPFQHLIISIINGWRWLRLLYEVYNGHHNVLFSHGWGQSWLCPWCLRFTPRLSDFEPTWAIHSISTLQTFHCKYIEWFCKVEIWTHHPQPSPIPGF